MALERIKEVIAEIRELVDKVQSAIDERPLLQNLIEQLKAKLNEAEEEVEAE